ncbi:hypothetical protein BKA66DRAFT_271656 [Pyrenochaeta sp. MPI-SDFR-AT-0127]|nr:hypothetical protein BKA66DRAFT_271656 [Pyrenochaeta sp. MPI-SDFR-AT-0127]
MQLSHILFRIALLCAPVALIGSTWLYFYPIFQGCAFSTPPSTHAESIAPFRLLALGDPQLEGDSSLPDPNARIFPAVEYLIPHLRDATTFEARQRIIVEAAKGVAKDAKRWLEGKRKAIDLWGNDWYLAHIVRSQRWWTEPTHISVLGDLLGSQWVTDGEFERRAGRYWNIVMRGLEKVPESIFGVIENDNIEVLEEEHVVQSVEDSEVSEHEKLKRLDHAEEKAIQDRLGEMEEKQEVRSSEQERKKMWGGTTEILGADKSWEKRVINIAGNHDVGYAGDIDESRITRFEKAFGSVNWDIWFTLPESNTSDTSTEDSATRDKPPALRLVILNSMNIDTPAWSSDLQTETYSYINHIITTSRPVQDKTHATILLTHIPLEKEAGVCVDSPYFDFFDGGHGVKEQNMLSDHSSKIVLEGLFGMSGNKDAAGGGLGRRGVVVNGHDHAGCDVVHWIRQPGMEGSCNASVVKAEEAYWSATPTSDVESATASMTGFTGVGTTSPNDINPFLEANTTSPSFDQNVEPVDMKPEPDPSPKWKARRFPPLPYDIDTNHECIAINQSPHIREVTLRSMMGEFSGYAGFLSAWYDPSIGVKGEWVFDFSTCGVGVQHWWWAVHVIDLITIVLIVSTVVVSAVERMILYGKGEKVEMRNCVVSSSARTKAYVLGLEQGH